MAPLVLLVCTNVLNLSKTTYCHITFPHVTPEWCILAQVKINNYWL